MTKTIIIIIHLINNDNNTYSARFPHHDYDDESIGDDNDDKLAMIMMINWQ